MKHTIIIEKNRNTTLALNDGNKLRTLDVVNLVPNGQKVKIEISDFDPKEDEEEQRTLRQNNYYRLLLRIIAKETGDTPDALHKQFKIKFLGSPEIVDGKEVLFVGSTRSLKISEFADYLEQVFHFSSEFFGIILPEPKSHDI